MGKIKPLEQVIADLKKRCGSDCDFSLINKENYVDTHHPILVKCKHCGKVYPKTPHDLMRRGGHLCKRPTKITLEYFFGHLTEEQKEKYDYSLVKEIANGRSKISIICKRCGKVFEQEVRYHLRGQNCPYCWAKQKPQYGHRKPLYGIGVLDVDYALNNDKITNLAYKHWHNIFLRCYSKSYQERNPNYIGCTIDERWHKFSAFKEWFVENYRDGYVIDKDLLVCGNKVYSPDACCVIPQEINCLIVTRHRKSGRFGKGLSITPKGKYIAFITKHNKTYNLGHFNTIEEAFATYKQGKISYVREVADAYYKDGKITKEVYDALYRYEPKFKD